MKNPMDEEIKELLLGVKKIAVVGLSNKPERTSYKVSEYMQQQGFDIIPVNPMIEAALGVRAYASLLDIEEEVDLVNVFRRSEDTVEPAKEAAQIKAKGLWLQLGIENEEAARIAADAGLKVVMDRCIKVEHQRLLQKKKT